MADQLGPILNAASSRIADLLAHLRAEAGLLRERHAAAGAASRQLHRSADELAVQRSFAEQLGTPAVGRLRQQEIDLRARIAAADEDAANTAEALKRLEQLIRQTEMSSSTLTGATVSGNADPWALALRSQIIHGREEERVRLAREVHDGPAQVLANVLMGLEHAINLQQSQPAGLVDFLGELRAAARSGLHEVRGFIADLRPGALDQGFANALRAYIHTYQRTTQINVALDIDNWPAVPAETEIVLYRIIQEALQNINKHARKANVAIRSYQQAGVLIVVIRDDGPGFDPREVLRRSGKESWGLTSMRERIALVGGEFAIASRPGSGTEVTLRIAL
ncbi:MAG TPA: sensor histidine kinase [Herpetosiphonaceae bacterium]|nr:sensor histidine kinase [Herpetosiphonaceae bacterium]